MQQTANLAAGTRTPNIRLVVLPNKAQAMPLLHSADAQMVGEDNVTGRK